MSQYANTFPIGPSNVQIGIVIYSDNPHLIFNLNNHTDNTTLVKAIQNIQYIRGSTNTAEAIRYVLDNSFTPEAGDRDTADNVLIVITDGQSNNKSQTLFVSQRIHARNLTTYAIGVGSGADAQEIAAIASDADHVFNVTNYEALATLQRELSRAACIGIYI